MRNAKKDFWEGTASSFDCLSKGQKFSRDGIYDRPNFPFDCTERGFRIYDLGVASGCEKFLQNVAVEIHRFGLNFTMKWFADIIRAHPTPLRNISNEKKTFEMKHKTAMKHIDVEHGKFARFRAASGVYDCCCKQRLWKIESSFSNHDLNWLPQTMRARIQNSWGFKLQLKLFRSLADFWSFRVENSSEFDSINDDASSQQPTCWQNVN